MVTTDLTSTALALPNNGRNGQHPLTPALAAPPRFGIGRDALNKGLQTVHADDRQLLERFWTYCNDRGFNRTQLGRTLKKENGEYYSPDSIYQFLTGRRDNEASIARMLAAIESFMRDVDPLIRRDPVAQTSITKAIQDYCQRAVKSGRIGFIVGDFATGKSVSLADLARRFANFIYTEMPAGGWLSLYLRTCARKLGYGDQQNISALYSRVIDGFRPGMGLLVDEVDRAFDTKGGMKTFDFFRHLWNETGLGLVFCMDEAGYEKFIKGDLAKRLRRLFRRRLPILRLPSTLYKRDLDLLAATVGLEPAPNEEIAVTDELTREKHRENPAALQREVMKKEGLFVWMEILRDAKETADQKRRKITWGAVVKSHAMFKADDIAIAGDQDDDGRAREQGRVEKSRR